jgi:hypothetical protein
MFETFFESLLKTLAQIPFTGATWFVIAIILFFCILFARANRDPKNPVAWEHMIIDASNDRVSPYKLGYLVGMIISTWVVITFADHEKLSYDIFGLYLTYLLGGASWNTFVKSKAPRDEDIGPDSPSDVSRLKSANDTTDPKTPTVAKDGKLSD